MNKPLTFDEYVNKYWVEASKEVIEEVESMHAVDARKEIDSILQSEYEIYLVNFNNSQES